MLDLGILAYQKVVDSEETPLALFSLAAKRLVNRLQFRGKMGTAIKVWRGVAMYMLYMRGVALNVYACRVL